VSNALLLVSGTSALIGTSILMLWVQGMKRRTLRQVEERMLKIAPLNRSVNGMAEKRGVYPPERLAKLPSWLQTTMARADFVPDVHNLLALSGATLATALLLAWRLDWIAAIGGPLLMIAIVLLTLRVMAARRINKLIEGLPFFFDAIRQMMTAGGSLQQALIRANDNADFCMRRYMDPVMRRVQNGASVADSLAWQAGRLNVAELHMFAIAVQASMQYGGRLSVVLANLTATLRDRTRVTRELRAATAEMRVSAYVIGALPMASGLVIGLMNPRYVTFFIHDPIGHELLGVAVGMQVIGVLAMRHLMRLDY
jgi:tight adherence protein B